MVQKLICSTEVRFDIPVGHAGRKSGAGLQGLSQQPMNPRTLQSDRTNGADQLHGQQASIGRDRR
jgi:hypothetical protein